MKTLLLFITMLCASSTLFAQQAGQIGTRSFSGNFYTGRASGGRNADTNNKTSFTITDVTIHIIDGTIRKLYIKSADRVFHNHRTTISLSRFNTRLDDVLACTTNNQEYVYLGDVLQYSFAGASIEIPNDTVITITSANTNVTLWKSDQLQVNLRAYSDLQGVTGDEDNGLVQLEGNLKIILITQNLRDRPIFAFQSIEPYFSTARFDSKYGKTAIESGDSINRMNVFQRSGFTFGTKLNLFKFIFRTGHTFEIKSGYQYNTSKVTRIVGEDSTDFRLALHSIVIQAPLSFHISKSIHFNCNTAVSIQKPGSSNSTDFISNLRTNTILQNEFLLAFSIAKENKLNKIFLRFNIFTNFTEKGNNFTQLQLGYERSLADLIAKL